MVKSQIYSTAAVISFNLPDTLRVDFSDIEHEVTRIIKEKNIFNFVIDMTPVQRLTSAQLGTFISIFRSLHTQDGHLLFANISDRLTLILQKTRLDNLFNSFDSIEQALKHLETPRTLPSSQQNRDGLQSSQSIDEEN